MLAQAKLLGRHLLPALLTVMVLTGTLGLLLFGLAPAAHADSDLLPTGMFSTQGNQIVDKNHNPVRLICVYWPVDENNPIPYSHSSPISGISANVNAIASAGFNCIRVDISNNLLHGSGAAAFLSTLDQVVSAASSDGLRIIIDDHSNEGIYYNAAYPSSDCAAQQANGLWYDSGGASNGTDGCGNTGHTTQASYQSDWVSIATRYAGNNTVIGYDLWNEPLSPAEATPQGPGSTWGNGSNTDVRLMYENVGSAMLAHDSSKLIIAECPENWGGSAAPLYSGIIGNAPWGDCTGVSSFPVAFTVNGHAITNKTVYDVHLYPDSVNNANIGGPNNSASPQAIAAMNTSFGFLESQNIAPVWDGESGTGFANNPDDQNWANMVVQYGNGGLGAQGGPTFSGSQQGMSFAWMAWSLSSTTYDIDDLGLLDASGTPIPAQMNVLFGP